MRYFISAGEASGDLHASCLIRSLRQHDTDASFTFLGGDLMAAEAGTEPVVHYRDMAFMGFVDVVLNLRKVLGNLAAAKTALRDSGADCLILVDYPSFNLKLAEYAVSKLKIPVYYYISPKVWAWKEYRVKSIRRLVRRMFSILPFEVDFYRRHNYEISYVGNPSVNEVDAKLAALPGRVQFLADNGLDSRPVIALLPGSRVSEIKTNLKLMVEAASRFERFQPVIAAAPGVDKSVYDTVAPGVKRVAGQTFELVAMADAALVTSGTATLETALIGTPQVVAYRAVGSRLVYNLFKHILKVRFVSLPNLIMDREIVTELLLHQCTADNLAGRLAAIVGGGSQRPQMLDDYRRLRERLGTGDAADTAAAEIVADLRTLN